MDLEIEALEHNNTWKLVTLPPEKKLAMKVDLYSKNTRLMGPLRGTRLGWLVKDSLKHMKWITWKLLHQL